MIRDYKIDEDGDLIIQNGDFVFDEATQDNQRLLLLAEKGEWKHAAMAPVGLRTYLDDENPQSMLREIRRRFTQDGMKVKELSYDGRRLNFKAGYDG